MLLKPISYVTIDGSTRQGLTVTLPEIIEWVEEVAPKRGGRKKKVHNTSLKVHFINTEEPRMWPANGSVVFVQSGEKGWIAYEGQWREALQSKGGTWYPSGVRETRSRSRSPRKTSRR
jgi:hypothetical protein